ncbi:MAG TPA: threonine/serine dehydratase [Candidatus Polarisedimenticolia bacterium]|nr:threonine/serine dehydratase [Candidatus Polarisedimenticolia bacterium]
MRDLVPAVEAAAARIAPHVRQTPVEASPELSRRGGAEVFLKLENLQATGSFKLRGAMHKLLVLGAAERARGVVTASSGNHGAAVAFGLQALGGRGTVFVPENVSPAKLAAIRERGATVRAEGLDSGLSEILARRYAEDEGLPYVSPYNDPDVVAGQGTVGVELARQVPEIDALFVAIGGGGLIGGSGGYLKGIGRKVTVVACSPENSAVMHHSLAAGKILEMESLPTLSDGTAGGVEPGTITFDLCREVVDDSVLVSEAEIGAALRLVVACHHTMIEGSAAVAVAAYLKVAERFRGRRVGIVLCGANIALEKLAAVLSEA